MWECDIIRQIDLKKGLLMNEVRCKRVYEHPYPGDGVRVLVDRLWPRGLARDVAAVDAWEKALAPSNELRKWYGHDPKRYEEFRKKYMRELDGLDAAAMFVEMCRNKLKEKNVTLLYAAKDAEQNNAVVLREWMIGCYKSEDVNMEHTSIEKGIIEEYEQAVDVEVLDFVRKVTGGVRTPNYITVAFLSKQTSREIRELTGKDVAGNRVVLDVNAVKHIDRRHGHIGEQDHSMEDIRDIARIGYVIMNCDEVLYDGGTTSGYLDETGKPAPIVVLKKRIDGTYYVIEAVSASKAKRCYIVSAYISKAIKEQPSNP